MACDGMDQVYHLAADMGGIGYVSTHHAEILHNSLLIDLNMVEIAKNSRSTIFIFIFGMRIP